MSHRGMPKNALAGESRVHKGGMSWEYPWGSGKASMNERENRRFYSGKWLPLFFLPTWNWIIVRVLGGAETDILLNTWTPFFSLWGWFSLRGRKWRYLPSIEKTVALGMRDMNPRWKALPVEAVPFQSSGLGRLLLLAVMLDLTSDQPWVRPVNERVLWVSLGP